MGVTGRAMAKTCSATSVESAHPFLPFHRLENSGRHARTWGPSHTRQLPSLRQAHGRKSSFICGGEFAAVFRKTLDHSAPDASVHPTQSTFPGTVARLLPRGCNPDDQTLISEDRKGAVLSEGRGNQKQTVPQRRKKSAVLHVSKGSGNLSRPSGKKKRK